VPVTAAAAKPIKTCVRMVPRFRSVR